MTSQQLRQIHIRYFHPEKSPGGQPDMYGFVNYTGSDRTFKRRFDRDRSSLIWNSRKQGTFIGNVRKTFKL